MVKYINKYKIKHIEKFIGNTIAFNTNEFKVKQQAKMRMRLSDEFLKNIKGPDSVSDELRGFGTRNHFCSGSEFESHISIKIIHRAHDCRRRHPTETVRK